MRRGLHRFDGKQGVNGIGPPAYKGAHEILRLGTSVFLMSIALLLTGCETVRDYSLTGRLWNNAEFRHFAEPASDPHLELFIAPPNDLLVCYDEVREQDERIRRRAYFLRENLDRVARRRKPKFVNPQLASNLVMLPLETLSSTASSPFVSYDRDRRKFSVVGIDRLNGIYELPAYVETNGNVTRVALTPLAVAGDTAVVATVVGLVAAYAYLASADASAGGRW